MARLPQVNGDEGNWGAILNDFLSVAHDTVGAIKPGSIVESQLDSAVQTKLNSGGGSGVSSINTRTGAVTLTKSDVGLGSVDNTSDAGKPISNLTQTALDGKAADTAVVHNTGAETVAGVKTFSSSPVVPTPTTSTQAANKSYVDGVTPNLTAAGRIEQARATGDMNPRWISRYTANDFSTTVANLTETYVSMKGGAYSASFLASWHNEWGALRGTSPYVWGDALVRAVRSVGDAITEGSFIEIDDRTVTPNVKRWGRRWVDGAIVRNGQRVNELYTWSTGDDDPTVGGTISLPAGARWVFNLGTSETLPSWAPAGSIVIRS